MRLLFFLSSMSSGGAERVCANLSNYWAGRGWDIIIVTVFGIERDFYSLHPSIRRVSLGLGGDSKNIAKALKKNWETVQALRKILIQERPEVALSFMDRSNVLLAMAKGTVPSIGSERIHPPSEPQPWVWQWLRKRYYHRLFAIVALAEESAEWLRKHTSARSVTVISNPVLWPLPVLDPIVDPPSKLGHRLLAIGRLVPQKQFDLLVDVFAQISALHPQWELYIVGDGPELGRLQARVSASGCPDRIHFPGRIGNLSSWYASSDLYVLTSRYEGFPNALIEALAHGVPAVSFDCDTGPRDILRVGVDGLLVEPENRAALGEALGLMMGNDALRLRMAKKASEARERFSIDLVAGKWELLFRECLAESREATK